MTTAARHVVTGSTTRSRASSDALVTSAVIIGWTAALVSLGGLVSVVIGDDMVPLDVVTGIAAALSIVGLIAVSLIRDVPGSAAVGMTVAPIGYAILFGDAFGSWWATYRRVAVEGGPAENAFWWSMPAIGLFLASGALFALAAALAALSWADKTTNEGALR